MMKKVGCIFKKVLDLCSLLWYVVLTGGAIHKQSNKRLMKTKENFNNFS